MHYIDASAFLKLIIKEKESLSLSSTLPNELFSSEILMVEVMRTVVNSDDEIIEMARKRLRKVNFIPADSEVFSTATFFGSQIKSKTLDSIHLASALSIGPKLEGLITYDKTMIADAKKLGISVLSPV